MTIKKVPTNHPDLLSLVDELNQFFVAEWGEDTTLSYANHHNLDDMHSAFVAYENNVAIGCACWKLRSDNLPEVKQMYVKSDYRGANVSGQLLEEIETDIKKTGFDFSVLETGSDMTQAIRFYEKQGYKIVPNFAEFIGDTLCVCLKKDLTKN